MICCEGLGQVEVCTGKKGNERLKNKREYMCE